MRDKIKNGGSALASKTAAWWSKMWDAFTEKRKFAVLDVEPADRIVPQSGEQISSEGSFEEGDGRQTVVVRWHIFISPLRITAGILGLVLVIFLALFFLLGYSPMMNMIPGYPGSKSREMLIAGIMRLDSLEREMEHLSIYSDNIALVMEGQTPVVRDPDSRRIGDSVQVQEKRLVPPSAADSALRAKMRGAGEYGLAGSIAAARHSLRALDMVAPAQGLVQTHFNPRTNDFGVEIVTTSNQPVMAIREGNVILSLWTPDEGGVVQIQHSDNLVSSYKHLSAPRVDVGDRVKTGQIIGTAGSTSDSGNANAKPLGLELWYNGTPVDPENYIVF